MEYWYFQNECPRTIGGRIPMLDGYQEGDLLALVYTGTAASKDEIFSIHNRDDRPRSGVIRSMSVGDVVLLKPPMGTFQAWAVERVGWKEVRVTRTMLEAVGSTQK